MAGVQQRDSRPGEPRTVARQPEIGAGRQPFSPPALGTLPRALGNTSGAPRWCPSSTTSCSDMSFSAPTPRVATSPGGCVGKWKPRPATASRLEGMSNSGCRTARRVDARSPGSCASPTIGGGSGRLTTWGVGRDRFAVGAAPRRRDRDLASVGEASPPAFLSP